MLYFSYGMNTNRNGMAQRCPGAVSLGHARLIDHTFRFAVHADVVKCSGSYVDGVLWRIEKHHLTALDSLEGYPFYYNRRPLRVHCEGRTMLAETYYMTPGKLDDPPGQSYFDMVVEGYREHNVPLDQLYNSVYESTTANLLKI